MTPDAVDLLLVYLLVLLCLIEISAGIAAFCTLGERTRGAVKLAVWL
jgi:hypothetical protein